MNLRKLLNLNFLITLFSGLLFIFIFQYLGYLKSVRNETDNIIKVGFVYEGDESTPYTNNFISAQNALEREFGDRINIFVKNNVSVSSCDYAIKELIEDSCYLIFLNSYSFQVSSKAAAKENPCVHFCQATGDNSLVNPLPNYHTFMGEIYQGRYISGLVAGKKLEELIKKGQIEPSQSLVGYVAAFPYAEVISGYTAFLLGVRTIVPDAKMYVRYTNTWNNFSLEKECAKKLIDDGCIIIGQHSDSIGPAVAVEDAHSNKIVFHVGYNQSMLNIAPTTSLISSKINWYPYIREATRAVLFNRPIEKALKVHVHGNDAGAGFESDWVQMLELNEIIAAEGSRKLIDDTVNAFKKGHLPVFIGNYVGKNPYNINDTCNLEKEFKENETRSAPSFCYILDDVVNCVQ
ncbi:MAG: BMP family ABC transporter substrate-binding protein [Treponema sp.]|nr:BMP family ABC transporter substrate-binding protein [Treponema sp.]